MFLSSIPVSSTNCLGPFLVAKFTHRRPVEEEAAWMAVNLGERHSVFTKEEKAFRIRLFPGFWQIPPLGRGRGGGPSSIHTGEWGTLPAGHSQRSRKLMDQASEQTFPGKGKFNMNVNAISP